MRISLIAICFTMLLAADAVEHTAKNAPPSGLLAGTARVDILPPAGIAHLNWGSQRHIDAAGVDPIGMYATALVLSDGKRKFAMVDIDTCLVENLDDALALASKLTGIPAEHIRFAATHTHSGPRLASQKGPLGADLSGYRAVYRDYERTLAGKVVGAIVAADRALRPAHLYGAKGIGTVNIHRRVRASGGMPAAVGRNPEGFVDRDLLVLRIDGANGKPLAVIVNFQCHGTVMGYENQLITPDWVGMTRRVVEQAMPGALCLFFQGAAGNQGPQEGFTGDLSVAHRLGAILGHQAAALALTVETAKREPRFEGFVESTAYQARQYWRVAGARDSALSFARRTVLAPRRRYSRAEVALMQSHLRQAAARAEELRAAGDPWKTHQAEARMRRFSDLLKNWEAPPDPSPIAVDLQVLRIGDVAIVAMPGEPFAEIGVAVKQASPFPVTLFCGYSSGAGGEYMPVEEEYAHGGYEVERTPYAPSAAKLIIDEARKLLEEVR